MFLNGYSILFALKAENVGVKFILHHQKTDTLLETLINLLNWKKNRRGASQFGGKEAFWPLRDISFSVKKGESLGVIGRNGAGKSTLLQLLTGIYKPDEGIIEKKGISGLLQIGTGFHYDLTGRENIYLNGTILGVKKREIDAL